MERGFRLLKRILRLLGLVLLLVIVGIAVVSALTNWQGLCTWNAGETFPCSRFQFALRELFWLAFLFIPYFFIAGILHLFMSLAQFIKMLCQRRRDRK